jgi:translation elongation factor P/translation initiation factor 5A
MADASLTHTIPYEDIKRHGFVIIKGQPCALLDIVPKVKGTGPTANDRATIKGNHIFTGKKMEDVHNITQMVRLVVWLDTLPVKF